MEVYWHATLSDGQKISGTTEDGSWTILKANLANRKITSLYIDSQIGTGKIDDNRDGYFISNRVVTAVGGSSSIYLVGIGYWRKDDEFVRIKWYRRDNMQLATTEARPLTEVSTQDSLITF